MRERHIVTTHYHTHPFRGPLSGTTRVSQYQKGKPIWILLKQETVSGIGISWAICKSAPRPTNSVKALKAILIIHTTNRKYHMAYRFMPFPVTLDDLEGHSSNAVLVKCSSTNICATFCTVLTDMACRTVH